MQRCILQTLSTEGFHVTTTLPFTATGPGLFCVLSISEVMPVRRRPLVPLFEGDDAEAKIAEEYNLANHLGFSPNAVAFKSFPTDQRDYKYRYEIGRLEDAVPKRD